MAFLYLSALSLVGLAALPFVLVLIDLSSLAALPVTLYARSFMLVFLAAGLCARKPVAWWLAVAASALYSAWALLSLVTAQLGDWWALTNQPRLLLLLNTIAILLAAGTFSMLLLPATRAAMARRRCPSQAWWQCLTVVGVMTLALLPAWLVMPRYPVLVDDAANVLSVAEERQISRYHGLLRSDYNIDYRIVTGENLGDLDRYAVEHFRQQAIGDASTQAYGLLLILDTTSNQVRLEVGYALEPVFVDAFVSYIEQQQMTEFFAVSRIADGILATTELIIQRAEEAASNNGVVSEFQTPGTGGGGARTEARLGEGPSERRNDSVNENPEESPEAVLATYQRAMAEQNNNPDLAIYSLKTREMLEDWVMTPAQMDNVARSLRECKVERAFHHGESAVLRYPIAERTCPPYFFVWEQDHWRLDFTVMVDALRFGRGNQWRLEPGYLGRYVFAFRDLRFDRNGYPYEAN